MLTQPKVYTSSEEFVTGEDERGRILRTLYAPSPLLRTSSGTHTRPVPRPRSQRNVNSGECQLHSYPYCYLQLQIYDLHLITLLSLLNCVPCTVNDL